MAVESKTAQLIYKNEMEAKLENTTERTSESTTVVYDDNSTFLYEEVYYSILDSPVQCKVNERVDYKGKCRVVFWKSAPENWHRLPSHQQWTWGKQGAADAMVVTVLENILLYNKKVFQ